MRNSLPRLFGRAATRIQGWRVEGRTAALMAVSFLLALAIVLLSTQFAGFSPRIRPSDWTAGRVAKKDFEVDRAFVFVDEQATALRRADRERFVPPVYRLNDQITADSMQRFGSFSDTLTALIRDKTSEDIVFLRLQADFPGFFSRSDVHALLAFPAISQALNDTRKLLQEELSSGVINLSDHREEILDAGGIELWIERDDKIQSEQISLDRLDAIENLSQRMLERVSETVGSDAERRIVFSLLESFATENAFYDGESTRAHRTREGDSVAPVTETLAKGQVLVRGGDIISEATAEKIRALGQYSITVNLNGIFGSALFLLLIFIVGVYLFSMKNAGAGPLKRNQVILVLSTGLAYILLAALLMRFLPRPDWLPEAVVIPTSTVAILITILVSAPAGISFSLVIALSLSLLSGTNIQSFLFAFLSGLAGTAVVMNAERRIDLIRAGLILAFIDSMVLAVLGLLGNYDPARFFWMVIGGLANGFFSSVLALGFLPIFEHLLNAPTRFRLLELADLNSDIFKQMLSRAPGTYTHSIGVANLAEAACEAIGANALLARVSGYYHDIGKIEQADFFIENQRSFNKHDEMRASLSAAVIKSHVRIGVEKAKELALPPAIIDIIAQHHGRGLIAYFYHRAVNEEKNPKVSREDYSYPGSKPKTREAAVLMLADSVEAASRTLRKPTQARLESFVWDTIMSKFNSGELGDSNLTLRDLELVRKAFVQILEGHYHTRIEYPRLRNGTGGETKPPERESG